MTEKEIKFFDTNIDRKSSISDKNLVFFKDTNIPMPSVIEISNSGMCNRKCSFCPRSDPNYDHVNEFIDQNLHDKIYEELKSFNYSGSIIYSGFVEPLLDKRIYKHIKDIREKLPNVNLEIITNGDPLNDKRALKLFEAGISVLLISVYDGPKEAENFLKMMKRINIDKSRYVIRNRYYGEDKDFGITLSNRAGNLNNAEFKIEPLKESLKMKCTYPSYTFFIDYNGDVLMCSHDWGKKMIMGNVKNNSIKEIWTSKKFDFARKKLSNADRNFSPCNVCDVKGTLIGNKHAEQWSKIR
tara:strand:+ start:22462 stop:23355 length:894 start_codon:yes stop_codon:yes gene_type:complete